MISEAVDWAPEHFGIICVRFICGFRRFDHFLRVRERFISELCTKTVTLRRINLRSDRRRLGNAHTIAIALGLYYLCENEYDEENTRLEKYRMAVARQL